MFSKSVFNFGKRQKTPSKLLASLSTALPLASTSVSLHKKNPVVLAISQSEQMAVSSEDTDSSLMDYQNAKPTTNYSGELVLNQPKKQQHKSSFTMTSNMDEEVEREVSPVESDINKTFIEPKVNWEADNGTFKDFISTNNEDAKVGLENSLIEGFLQIPPPPTFNNKDMNPNKNDHLHHATEDTSSPMKGNNTDINDYNKNTYETNKKTGYNKYNNNHNNNIHNNNNNHNNESVIKDLKDEVGRLRFIVHKLNSQLSSYQSQYELHNTNQEDMGFPLKGPMPSWLVSSKQLVPLLKQYDRQLLQNEKILNLYREEMESFKAELASITTENQRLHIQIEQTSTAKGDNTCNSMTYMRHLKEQCALVLEENHLLVTQMALQKERVHFFATQAEDKGIDFNKRESVLTDENERLAKENKKLYEEMSFMEGSKREDMSAISAEMKRSSNKEITEFSEKIVKFEFLLEETSYMKQRLEKDNQNLKEQLYALKSEVERDSMEARQLKKKVLFMKRSNSKLLKMNDKQRLILNSILTKTEAILEEKNYLLKSSSVWNEEKRSMIEKWQNEMEEVKKKTNRFRYSVFRKRKQVFKVQHRLKIQKNKTKLMKENYESQISMLQKK